MSDLYDTDAVTWAEQQAALLRRIAAGERVNDQVDWENVVEEIEDVGGGEGEVHRPVDGPSCLSGRVGGGCGRRARGRPR